MGACEEGVGIGSPPWDGDRRERSFPSSEFAKALWPPRGSSFGKLKACTPTHTPGSSSPNCPRPPWGTHALGRGTDHTETGLLGCCLHPFFRITLLVHRGWGKVNWSQEQPRRDTMVAEA